MTSSLRQSPKLSNLSVSTAIVTIDRRTETKVGSISGVNIEITSCDINNNRCRVQEIFQRIDDAEYN